jgi:8-oxo-dGTP pyrophosphatase MutT (NUDIX family)
MKKRSKEISIAIFIDDDYNIAFQLRGDHSRSGAKYGFWGGGSKPGETPKQTLLRELKEELNYTPDKFRLWNKHLYVVDDVEEYMGMEITVNAFLALLTDEVKKLTINEGAGMVVMPLTKALKEPGWHKEDKTLLELLDTFLKSKQFLGEPEV